MKELKIIETICEKHGISVIVWMDSLFNREEKYSLLEIGIILGRRDHSTIFKLYKKGQKKLSTG